MVVVKNEKGSLAFVIILGIIILSTIMILFNLLLNDRIQISNQDFEEEIYKTHNVLELIFNIFEQKLIEQEKNYEYKTFYIINPDDELQEIEDAINNNVLPHFISNSTVRLSDLKYNYSLDMLCDEVEDGSVSCSHTFFDINFNAEVNIEGKTDVFNIIFKDVYPEISDYGYIKVNTDNKEIIINKSNF